MTSSNVVSDFLTCGNIEIRLFIGRLQIYKNIEKVAGEDTFFLVTHSPNVIDNFETALTRANKKTGIIVAISFGKGAYEEVARAKLEQGLEIELKTVSDILGEQ
jgi:hypothetical protein